MGVELSNRCEWQWLVTKLNQHKQSQPVATASICRGNCCSGVLSLFFDDAILALWIRFFCLQETCQSFIALMVGLLTVIFVMLALLCTSRLCSVPICDAFFHPTHQECPQAQTLSWMYFVEVLEEWNHETSWQDACLNFPTVVSAHSFEYISKLVLRVPIACSH